jgi:hypothetical protein
MADTAHSFAAQLQKLGLLLLRTQPRRHHSHRPLKQRLLRLLLLQPGTQILPSVLSCATGMVPSGQNMLLAVVSNSPINQWPKTT